MIILKKEIKRNENVGYDIFTCEEKRDEKGKWKSETKNKLKGGKLKIILLEIIHHYLFKVL